MATNKTHVCLFIYFNIYYYKLSLDTLRFEIRWVRYLNFRDLETWKMHEILLIVNYSWSLDLVMFVKIVTQYNAMLHIHVLKEIWNRYVLSIKCMLLYCPQISRHNWISCRFLYYLTMLKLESLFFILIVLLFICKRHCVNWSPGKSVITRFDLIGLILPSGFFLFGYRLNMWKVIK